MRTSRVREAAPWGAAVALAIGVISFAASRGSSAPVLHCAAGLVAGRTRCCAPGQTEIDGRCTGAPTSCPPALHTTEQGCVAPLRRVRIAEGVFDRSSTDWEAAGDQTGEPVRMKAFEIDATEVTEARWQACVDARACAERPLTGEPGRPVTGVSVGDAARLCEKDGGTLPTPEQHAFASAGAEGHRYPWGPTGAVCRRAVWGRARGPCGHGAKGPEIAGAFADGATSTGIYDLAGNTAEWARSEDGTRVEARGGSFRDDAAAALRTWSGRVDVPEAGQDDVGFRCVYPSGTLSD